MVKGRTREMSCIVADLVIVGREWCGNRVILSMLERGIYLLGGNLATLERVNGRGEITLYVVDMKHSRSWHKDQWSIRENTS